MRHTPGRSRGTWATYVQTAREAAQLSKAELARRIHVDRSTVIRWEQDTNKPEDPGVVGRFATLLALDLDEALIAAGLMPANIRDPRPPQRHLPEDPDLRRLVVLFESPDTPEVVREQIRGVLRGLAELAEARQPRKRTPRKRSA